MKIREIQICAMNVAMPMYIMFYGMILSGNVQHTVAFVPYIGRMGMLPSSSYNLCGTVAFDRLDSCRTSERKIGSTENWVNMDTSLMSKDRDTDDDDEFEYARVRRRRDRRRYADDEDAEIPKGRATDEVNVGRERDTYRENQYDDEIDYDEDDEDDYFDDDDDDDDDDEFDDEFDGIIPNAQLDSIDPDGALDRVGDLFADPKFWRDVVLLLIIVSIGAPENPLGSVRFEDIDFEQFYK